MPADEKPHADQEQGLARLISERRDKLASLREAGSAYPNDFRPDDHAGDLQLRYASLSKEELAEKSIPAKVAGRIMLRRVMGKASFLTLQDLSGRIQCYLRKDGLGEEAYNSFIKHSDLGDLIGVSGALMKTNTGELTIEVRQLQLLTKAMRPLPEKFKGLHDTESRYRQRYLDLIGNEKSRRVFQTRSQIVQTLREWFLGHDFLEVETPMLHAIPGGAAAKPFITHHNALHQDMYLRIAPELFLKRLIVGGLERVFEVNRCFRNEGLSFKHNPEFTMLEFYQAYADYEALMTETEEIFSELAERILGTTELSYQGRKINLKPPYQRLEMLDTLAERLSCPKERLEDPEYLKRIATTHGLEQKPDWGVGKLQFELFESLIESDLVGPVFITQHPAEVSPLSRRNPDKPAYAERFELFALGIELANGFSEINDPEDQAQRFRAQAAASAAGDEEAMHYDQDYVEALEHGMPPTAGEGIGIDRLTMFLTDSRSIRDVILFPHLRPADQKRAP